MSVTNSLRRCFGIGALALMVTLTASGAVVAQSSPNSEDVIMDGQFDVRLHVTGVAVDKNGRLELVQLAWVTAQTAELCEGKTYGACASLEYGEFLKNLRVHDGRPPLRDKTDPDQHPVLIIGKVLTRDAADSQMEQWFTYLEEQDFLQSSLAEEGKRSLPISSTATVPATVYWQLKQADETFEILDLPRL